jgi:hypothetical protein
MHAILALALTAFELPRPAPQHFDWRAGTIKDRSMKPKNKAKT